MTSVRWKGNPFGQSTQYWNAVFVVSEAAAKLAHDAFDDMALSVAGFETDEKNKIWTFELLFDARPDEGELDRRLHLLAAASNSKPAAYTLIMLEQQDWLSKVAQDFPPLSIGKFYVHGKHVQEPPPVGSIPIQVDAGAAFGSGEHGTTRCCLEALDWLAKSRSFRHILDMGCGSGILAIAAAKLWKAPTLAVDIDPVAVQVTQSNVKINRATGWVTSAVSDGYGSERVQNTGPYDLIVSNILARPLVKFAPDLKANLKGGGIAVLSGLLTSQEVLVRSAHMVQGLKLKKRFVHSDWCTLVLE